MKTLAKYVSLALTAALPVAFATELAGVSLPAALSSMTLFPAVVSALVALTALSDYAPARCSRVRVVAHPSTKADHPLAA